ncbi:MAG: hypothetical protein ACI8TX_002755 [Hyphomicrobiaceae bacterium]|jgi:hypothetical protein
MKFLSICLSLCFLFLGTPSAHADAERCRASIDKAAANYVHASTKALARCEDRALSGKTMVTDCQADAASALIALRAKLDSAIAKGCGAVTGSVATETTSR